MFITLKSLTTRTIFFRPLDYIFVEIVLIYPVHLGFIEYYGSCSITAPYLYLN